MYQQFEQKVIQLLQDVGFYIACCGIGMCAEQIALFDNAKYILGQNIEFATKKLYQSFKIICSQL